MRTQHCLNAATQMRFAVQFLLLFLVGFCSAAKEDAAGKRVVCYYTNWSVYRPGTAKFSPQNINPYLCTHLIYAFGGLTRENGLRPFDKYQDIEQGGYAKFTGLKTYNKDLKTMLAIGGWNEGSARFSPLVADADRRKEFVRNALRFLRQNHFDGLDLDWEYPAFRDGGKARDRDNYALLVKELREEFDRESEKTGRTRLLLTMAVPAGIEYIDKGFDIATLNRYLDFMNILSYDYHSAFEPAVNHHAPLFSEEEDDEYNFDAQLTIDHTISHYMKLGAERSKLVLGIPTYGRSYTLFNPLATDLGSPADGPGEQGDSTREKGYLAYYEICEYVKNDDWNTVQPSPKAMGPYAFKGNQWVSYDDIGIIKKKAQYVNDKGLGGIMFWAIDNDDFRGNCHGRAYPLIEAGKEAMVKGIKGSNEVQSQQGRPHKRPRPRPKTRTGSQTRTSTSSTTTTTTTSTTPSYFTPEPPTTPDPGSDFKCKDEGFFPHPRDCKKYFWCLDSGPSNLGIVAHQFTCPSGLFFNKAADSCDYTRNVICNKKSKSTPSTTTTSTTPTTPITTKTSPSTTTTTTTTTTTVAPADSEEDAEEYEEYEDETQEDPQALKELILLIKKLGGVEQLEKQLNLQSSNDAADKKTTDVSRSLYNKLVSYNSARAAATSTTTPRYKSLFRNRPEKPQNDGLEKIEEAKPARKPTYVNIRRERPSTPATSTDEEKDEEEDDEEKVPSVNEEDEEDYAEENPASLAKTYITIQRNRQTTQPSPRTESSSPRYVTLSRSRPTTESNNVNVDEENEDDVESEPIETSRPRTRYSVIERSTTNVPESTVTSRDELTSNVSPKTRYSFIARSTTSTPDTSGTSREELTSLTSPKTRYTFSGRFTTSTTETTGTSGDELTPSVSPKSRYSVIERSSTSAPETTATFREELTSNVSPKSKYGVIDRSTSTSESTGALITDLTSTISPKSVSIFTGYSTIERGVSGLPETSTSQFTSDVTPETISGYSKFTVSQRSSTNPLPETSPASKTEVVRDFQEVPTFASQTPGTTTRVTERRRFRGKTDSSSTVTEPSADKTRFILSTLSTRTAYSATTLGLEPVQETTITAGLSDVLSASQQLLHNGIAEVSSSEQTSVSTSTEPSTTSTLPSTTVKHRGTPRVVRRRKLGPGTRKPSTTRLPENATRTTKVNFPRRVIVNATTDKDMELLESMDHVSRDNVLVTTQDSVTNTKSPVQSRRGSRYRVNVRPVTAAADADAGPSPFPSPSPSTAAGFSPTPRAVFPVGDVEPTTRPAATRPRKPFQKTGATTEAGVRPRTKPSRVRTTTPDYEYYDDGGAILDVAPLSRKVKIHSDGYIECLDQGNFPHPFSCKKFISCAKMESSELLGWEYTCPRQLSFDPIGGICNWSAGLGCKE